MRQRLAMILLAAALILGALLLAYACDRSSGDIIPEEPTAPEGPTGEDEAPPEEETTLPDTGGVS